MGLLRRSVRDLVRRNGVKWVLDGPAAKRCFEPIGALSQELL